MELTDRSHPLHEPPEHQNILTTRLDALKRWAQSGSLWPMPFGTACCAIEFMAVASPRYDIARLGSEVLRFSPRQADVLMVMGTITDKMGPVLKTIYEQMPERKWVICMGACATSGGFYRSYHVMQGIDEIIPVDVYIPGCPPTPEAVLQAILALEEKIREERPVAFERGQEARSERLMPRLEDASVTSLEPPSPALLAFSQAAEVLDHPWVAALQARLGPAAVEVATDFRGALSIRVSPARLLEVVAALAATPFDMDMLMDICGVDYWTRSPRFDIVYHFYSSSQHHRLRLKVAVGGSPAMIDSITGLWPAANWYEREVFDLFGIRFRGHPDLRRILTHDGFGQHHPMRKDYPPGLRQPVHDPAPENELPMAERSPRGEHPPLDVHPTIMNIGPSHPAMHGTFRLIAQMNGDRVEDADVELGYLHRNFEKMAETHTYWQTIPLFWLGVFDRGVTNTVCRDPCFRGVG
jgi:NADH-quinone oxidoreductase subunit B/C/D